MKAGTFGMLAVSTLAGVLTLSGPVNAADLGVGVTVGGQVAPGVYGRIDILNGAIPPVVYQQPVIITQGPQVLSPIYMNVPPGHAKNWSKHCYKYNACGIPVYFVRTSEYGPLPGPGRYEERREYDERRGRDRDDDDHDNRGRGNGNGRGRGHDRD